MYFINADIQSLGIISSLSFFVVSFVLIHDALVAYCSLTSRPRMWQLPAQIATVPSAGGQHGVACVSPSLAVLAAMAGVGVSMHWQPGQLSQGCGISGRFTRVSVYVASAGEAGMAEVPLGFFFYLMSFVLW